MPPPCCAFLQDPLPPSRATHNTQTHKRTNGASPCPLSPQGPYAESPTTKMTRPQQHQNHPPQRTTLYKYQRPTTGVEEPKKRRLRLRPSAPSRGVGYLGGGGCRGLGGGGGGGRGWYRGILRLLLCSFALLHGEEKLELGGELLFGV